jgi:hypothetical protein
MCSFKHFRRFAFLAMAYADDPSNTDNMFLSLDAPIYASDLGTDISDVLAKMFYV